MRLALTGDWNELVMWTGERPEIAPLTGHHESACHPAILPPCHRDWRLLSSQPAQGYRGQCVTPSPPPPPRPVLPKN
ncbi:hypothetical protein E2C01_049331 [Portunus trituberculatus]|uniref:Uncharacterized protein n=1 Tax=Portunus trituberculatus TaxID=210409 RepID=A0A5B7GCV3_PORTR|nr:hypothetical protein [Portunus trituberculatus]